MQPPSTLPELIEQLGRTYSPFERLKILGRAWSLLRGMTPEQRMIVAAQLGLDHADEVVETIAKRSGQKTSPALIALIEKAQLKGTPHLPELIADIRDPKRRGERLKQGALAVGDALAGEAVPESQWLPPGAAAPVEPSPPAAAPARRPEASPPAVRPAPQPAAPPPPTPAAVAPIAPAAPAVVEAAPALAVPSPPPPAQTTPSPEKAPPPRPAPAVPAVQPPGQGALADRLSAAPALTARFRLLRRHLGEAKGLSALGLRSVLEGFPDGWARRRALLELLRGGVPGSLGDALTLVETLGADRDRLWCLGTLAESREIPERDREAFLAAAISPLARRRLERRLGGG